MCRSVDFEEGEMLVADMSVAQEKEKCVFHWLNLALYEVLNGSGNRALDASRDALEAAAGHLQVEPSFICLSLLSRAFLLPDGDHVMCWTCLTNAFVAFIWNLMISCWSLHHNIVERGKSNIIVSS